MQLFEHTFSTREKEELQEAILEAENGTNGEVRIYFEADLPGDDPMVRAQKVFHQLHMDKTKERAGILVYIAFHDHKMAIIGDRGIDRKVDEGYWNRVRDLLIEYFRREEFVPGLKRAISLLGITLRKYFPKTEADINELPNEIIFNEEE